jgi:hypothetical protein
VPPRGRAPHRTVAVELEENMLDPIEFHQAVGIIYPSACSAQRSRESLVPGRVLAVSAISTSQPSIYS